MLARIGLSWRSAGWALAAGMLGAPAVAELLTPEVDWGLEDFIAAALLIGGAAATIEAAAWLSRGLGAGKVPYRAAAALCAVATLLMLWANLAVGIIGREGDPANLLFLLVPVPPLAVAALARFRPRGMMLAALSGVATLLAIPLIAAGPGLPQPFAWGVAAVLATPWLAAAWLFRRAAQSATTRR